MEFIHAEFEVDDRKERPEDDEPIWPFNNSAEWMTQEIELEKVLAIHEAKSAEPNLLTESGESFLHFMDRHKLLTVDITLEYMARGFDVNYHPRYDESESIINILCEKELSEHDLVRLVNAGANILQGSENDFDYDLAPPLFSLPIGDRTLTEYVELCKRLGAPHALIKEILIKRFRSICDKRLKSIAEFDDLLRFFDEFSLKQQFIETFARRCSFHDEPNMDVVRILISRGYYMPNSRDFRSALCYSGSIELVELYLEALKETCYITDILGNCPYWKHVTGKLKFLFEDYVDPRAPCWNKDYPVHFVCRLEEPLELLEWLAKKGVSLESSGEGGDVPLHRASCYGNLEVVKFLIGEGVNVDRINDKFYTPLHKAVCRAESNADVIQELLNSGANINARNKFGWTPFHVASRYSAQLGSLRVLLDNGSDINCRVIRDDWQSKHNWITPLHNACEHGWLQVIQFLLDNGADPNAVCGAGKHPVDYLPLRETHLGMIRKLIFLGNHLSTNRIKKYTSEKVREGIKQVKAEYRRFIACRVVNEILPDELLLSVSLFL